MKALHLLPLLIIIFMFGCTKNEDTVPDGDLVGEFNVTVSGDLSKTIKGESTFVHVISKSGNNQADGSILTILLTSGNNEDEVITITIGHQGNTKGIGSGTYAIVEEPNEEDPNTMVGAYLDSKFTYLSISGEVKISRINNSESDGSLNVRMMDLNQNEVVLKGDFKSKGLTKTL